MILTIGTTPTLQRTMIFDRFTIDDVNRAVDVAEYASGKAINVARVCTTLGVQATALLFAGGRRGQALLEDLSRAGIPHRSIPISAQTRLCTTLIDRSRGTATELVEEPPRATESEWQGFQKALDDLIPIAQIAVFAGTLAPGAPEDFLARHLQQSPITITDAKGPPLLRVLSTPTPNRLIAKLNRDELAATLNQPLATDDQTLHAARQITPPHATLIVTAGKAGALVINPHTALRVNPPTVQAISAVGSGDAFTAGLAVALVQDQAFEDALRLAAACGAANALTPHSGHLHADNVQKLLPMTKIESI